MLKCDVTGRCGQTLNSRADIMGSLASLDSLPGAVAVH